MELQKYTPTPVLQSAVACYWIYEDDDTPAEPQSHVLLPSPLPSVMAVFSPVAPQLLSADGQRARQISPDSSWAYLRNRRLYLSYDAPVGLFGVSFLPCGFYQLFGVSLAGSLSDKPGSSEALGNFGRELARCVRAVATHPQRVASVEALLLTKFAHHKPCPISIADLVAHVLAQHGQVSVEEMAQQVNLSSRQLERRFREVVGIPPKLFAEICRFAYVFRLLQNQPLAKWQDVTHTCGYFDQSHFIREFRRFAGEAPNTYFQRLYHFEPMLWEA